MANANMPPLAQVPNANVPLRPEGHNLNRDLQDRIQFELHDLRVNQGLNDTQIAQGATQLLDGTPGTPTQGGNPAVDPVEGLRARYARVNANRTDSVVGLGWGLRRRNRATRNAMNDAAFEYSVQVGVLGVLAHEAFMRDSYRRQNTTEANATPDQRAAAEAESRGMSMMSYVTPEQNIRMRRGGRANARQVTIVGEGAKLASAVADSRKSRVDQKTSPARKFIGARFDRMAERYGRMSRKKKVAVALAVGVVGSAAAVATAGALAPVFGVAGSALAGAAGATAAGARATVFAKLENRHQQMHADEQTRDVIERLHDRHDTTQHVSMEEMVGGFNRVANKNIRKNRRNTVLAVGAAALGFHYAGEQSAEVARLGHEAAHGIRNIWRYFEFNHDHAKHAVEGATRKKHGSTTTGPGKAKPRHTRPDHTRPDHTRPAHNRPPTGRRTGRPTRVREAVPTGSPVDGTYHSLGAHDTAALERTWATGTNANEMLHIETTKEGMKFVVENMRPGETIINGHALNHLPKSAEILLTERTPEGLKSVYVPVNHYLSAAIQSKIEHGTFVDAELVIPHGQHGLYVLSTATGNNHEITNHAFQGMVHSGAVAHPKGGAAPSAPNAVPKPPVESIKPVELNVPQAEKYFETVFADFNAHVHPTHGATSEQLFGAAIAETHKQHVAELLLQPNGNISAMAPVANTEGAIWEHIGSGHLARLLIEELEKDGAEKGKFTLAA